MFNGLYTWIWWDFETIKNITFLAQVCFIVTPAPQYNLVTNAYSYTRFYFACFLGKNHTQLHIWWPRTIKLYTNYKRDSSPILWMLSIPCIRRCEYLGLKYLCLVQRRLAAHWLDTNAWCFTSWIHNSIRPEESWCPYMMTSWRYKAVHYETLPIYLMLHPKRVSKCL